jgi:hypothetical protein
MARASPPQAPALETAPREENNECKRSASPAVFNCDNGSHRFDNSYPYSRVLEIDVPSKEIVWKYQERRVSDFFSPRISNAQRRPNGNTLINDGWFGRFFEVTAKGEVVWEYVNPYFNEDPMGAQVNQVFRAYRYSAGETRRAWPPGA